MQYNESVYPFFISNNYQHFTNVLYNPSDIVFLIILKEIVVIIQFTHKNFTIASSSKTYTKTTSTTKSIFWPNPPSFLSLALQINQVESPLYLPLAQ